MPFRASGGASRRWSGSGLPVLTTGLALAALLSSGSWVAAREPGPAASGAGLQAVATAAGTAPAMGQAAPRFHAAPVPAPRPGVPRRPVAPFVAAPFVAIPFVYYYGGGPSYVPDDNAPYVDPACDPASPDYDPSWCEDDAAEPPAEPPADEP